MQETSQDLFRCPVCEKDASHPVVTECGHIFCWSCLYSGAQQTKKCPLCHRIIECHNSYPVFIQNETQITNDPTHPPRPSPSYRDKIINPSMANGGMPLGISSLPHNLSKGRIIAGISYFPTVIANTLNSPEPPRDTDPEYQIYTKCKIGARIFLACLLGLVILILVS